MTLIDTLRDGLRDRYAFERELGRGGMATVYLVQDLRHDRPVALKVRKDKAVELLKPLVEMPNNLSKAWLRVDFTWNLLRSHPAFQTLVAGTT